MERRLDREILDILEEDGRASVDEIALMLGVDAETVQKEIERLENEKVILRYAAVVNRQNLGDDEYVDALIEVKITPQRDFGYDDLARRIYRFEEVYSVYLVAGRYDLSVRVRARSMQEISKFVWEKLAVIDGVTSTATTFIMRKYKESGVVLIEEAQDDRLVVSP